MDTMGRAAFPDNTERRVIYKVAAAHGGLTVEGSKDTIGDIKLHLPLFNTKVRKRLLAAVLRFADELADDSTRASRYALEEGLIPKSSEVFHAYSKALKSCEINEREVSLSYELSYDDATRKYGKLDGEIYLIDEIFERTHKVLTECIYCMRYCREILNIEKIKVNVGIYDNEFFNEIHEPITYELQEIGYPDMQTNIFGVCPALETKTGEIVKSEIETSGS